MSSRPSRHLTHAPSGLPEQNDRQDGQCGCDCQQKCIEKARRGRKGQPRPRRSIPVGQTIYPASAFHGSAWFPEGKSRHATPLSTRKKAIMLKRAVQKNTLTFSVLEQLLEVRENLLGEFEEHGEETGFLQFLLRNEIQQLICRIHKIDNY